jgi:hypothetical protein
MSRRARRGDGVINDQQKLAVDEYLRNGCKVVEALIFAGYAVSTAKTNADMVFDNPVVKAYLEKRQAKIAEKMGMDAEEVAMRMARFARAPEIMAKYVREDKGSLYYDFTNADPEDFDVIVGIQTETYSEGRGPDKREVKKFKIVLPDSKGALDSLARILGMNNDKLRVSTDEDLIAIIQSGRNRVKQIEG